MNEPQVVARPAVYIDLVIDGRRQIFDVKTADRVVRELTLALNQLDQQHQDVAGAPETKQSRPPLKGDGLDRESGDAKRIVADVVARPVA